MLDLDVMGACRVCGWTALPGASLCVGCLDIQEWSRVNRAFCDLLHRAMAGDVAAGERALPLVDGTLQAGVAA